DRVDVRLGGGQALAAGEELFVDHGASAEARGELGVAGDLEAHGRRVRVLLEGRLPAALPDLLGAPLLVALGLAAALGDVLAVAGDRIADQHEALAVVHDDIDAGAPARGHLHDRLALGAQSLVARTLGEAPGAHPHRARGAVGIDRLGLLDSADPAEGAPDADAATGLLRCRVLSLGPLFVLRVDLR